MIGSDGVRVRSIDRRVRDDDDGDEKKKDVRLARRETTRRERRVVVQVGDSRRIAQSPPIDRWTRRSKKCRGGEEGTVWGCGTREGES